MAAAITLLVAIASLMVTPTAAGRVSPDPLPSYNSLSATPNRVVYDVDDHIGKKFVARATGYSDEEFFIWDLALVEFPDGTVATLRYEFQTSDGQLLIFDSSLSDYPSGSVEVHSMTDVWPSGTVVYSDTNGVIRMTKASNIQPGSIGSGGVIINPVGVGGGACRMEQKLDTCQEWPSCFFFGVCQKTSASSCHCGLPGSSRSCPMTWGEYQCLAVNCSSTCVTGFGCICS